jgi:hypothetical protein
MTITGTIGHRWSPFLGKINLNSQSIFMHSEVDLDFKNKFLGIRKLI